MSYHYPLSMALPHDPLWPRAQSLFSKEKIAHSDVSLFGIPASKTSLSPTSAHQSPDAIRNALLRYSVAHSNQNVDLSRLSLSDWGNLTSSDADESETIARVREIAHQSKFLIALGGDNSVTYSAAQGSEATGLITLDAHYDLRDGVSNGSPVRRLIESGLSGKKVVQIGIADFSNSPEYAKRAKDFGITVIPRSDFRSRSLKDMWTQALEIAGEKIFVDFDMDVCDRSVVPACPAAAPGGISADEIRQLAFFAGSSQQIVGIDITEIDSTIDSDDERTVRLAALVVLESIAGFSTRR
jgi:formiminoglutamase